ncbi:MAG TPA: PilZ domain-containing protein [Aggregicoccus sp.]|nr:PilZ domain-containing protein [Aggregicoccus sp.]
MADRPKQPGYWIGDSTGRVLGPLSLQALRDLVASGRLRGASRASRDGHTWLALPEFAEVKDLLSAPRPSSELELAQAERVRGQLRALRDLGPHETFGVRPDASLEELRGAFFRLAKPFQPDRLAPEAHAQLRAANAEMFELLSRRMREAEQRAGAAPAAARPASAQRLTPPPQQQRPTPPPPQRPAPPPAARAAPQPPPPFTYDASEFVGLQRRGEERLQADIKCTVRSVGIFTDHKVVNLSSGGIFIATPTPLRLGTRLNVTLHFDEAPGKMDLLGAVVWEYTLDDGRQPRGYGVRLDVRPAERKVLEEFVRKYRAPEEPKATRR